MVYPVSVVADAAGNVFVADRELPGVWKVADGALSLLFQGEKKFGTPLNAVRCLALDHKESCWRGTVRREKFTASTPKESRSR